MVQNQKAWWWKQLQLENLSNKIFDSHLVVFHINPYRGISLKCDGWNIIDSKHGNADLYKERNEGEWLQNFVVGRDFSWNRSFWQNLCVCVCAGAGENLENTMAAFKQWVPTSPHHPALWLVRADTLSAGSPQCRRPGNRHAGAGLSPDQGRAGGGVTWPQPAQGVRDERQHLGAGLRREFLYAMTESRLVWTSLNWFERVWSVLGWSGLVCSELVWTGLNW